jgi:hypothetical protein
MHDADPGELHLQHRRLRGGLQAASVTRLAVRYRDARGRSRVHPRVVKRLAGRAAREAMVYQELLGSLPTAFAPRLLAADQAIPGHEVLYLEALRPVAAWPWWEFSATREVLERAALLHRSTLSGDTVARLSAWDYETELEAGAFRTVEQLERLRRCAPPYFRNGLRWARRLAMALPALRRQLLALGPLGTSVIHGDLHSGNVILRRRGGRPEPVLLDWGRARIGSPLEDVSTWLQSLGDWEPETRRRHDTLFTRYLVARGIEGRLGGELRAGYWLAGASNALAGALSHHLSLLDDERIPRVRTTRAAHSAHQWMRVLRRADAFWS